MDNTPMSGNDKCRRFVATVYKIWMMRHIDVPEEISVALLKEMAKAHKSKEPRKAGNGAAKRKSEHPKYIPVLAIVSGKSARVTLVPAGGGHFRMQINTALRRAAQVDAGNPVSVELRLDLAPRDLPAPQDLLDGLKEVPKARKAFEVFAPGHRRHFIQWFDSAKSTAARQRRLERAIDVLLERAFVQPVSRSVKRRRR
jgi:hypothetical protein